MRCHRCQGLLHYEPARIVCLSCGREWNFQGDVELQAKIDQALFPRSAECRRDR